MKPLRILACAGHCACILSISACLNGLGGDQQHWGQGGEKLIGRASNLSAAETREAIRVIALSGAADSSPSSGDWQAEVLWLLGEQHVAILLEEMPPDSAVGSVTNEVYFIPAINDWVREEHKQAVIDRLLEKRDLIQVILGHDWTEDARTAIVDGVDGLARSRSKEAWLTALAQLDEPGVGPRLLKEALNETSGAEAAALTALLLDIPDVPQNALAKEVARLWIVSKAEGQQHHYAPAAAMFGNKEALRALTRMAKDDLSIEWRGRMYLAEELLLLLCDVPREARNEPQRWIESNWENIEYVPALRRFGVPGQSSAAEAETRNLSLGTPLPENPYAPRRRPPSVDFP